MTERQIAAHAYGYVNGECRFVLPCCEADVGVPDNVTSFGCPKCGKQYKRATLGETVPRHRDWRSGKDPDTST